MYLFELNIKEGDIWIVEIEDTWDHGEHEFTLGICLKVDVGWLLLDGIADGGSDDLAVEREDSHVVK